MPTPLFAELDTHNFQAGERGQLAWHFYLGRRAEGACPGLRSFALSGLKTSHRLRVGLSDALVSSKKIGEHISLVRRGGRWSQVSLDEPIRVPLNKGDTCEKV